MKSAQKSCVLPDGIEIGERFLLRFDSPNLAQPPQMGRLQDFRPDGALCIDVPAELHPPKGTPVTVSSLSQNRSNLKFTSEIVGRSRLNDRLPVLLVKAPAQLERQQQRRAAYRVSVAIKARAEWTDPHSPGQRFDCPAVVTNLSGGGAQVFLRHRPGARKLYLTLSAPDPFIEEWTARRIARLGTRSGNPILATSPFQQTCSQLRRHFTRIQCRIVRASRQETQNSGSMYLLSVAFNEPQEGCYRLVRYLERQTLQKGLETRDSKVATAA
jgi:hypothetical protein